jgi:hypothetical protein
VHTRPSGRASPVSPRTAPDRVAVIQAVSDRVTPIRAQQYVKIDVDQRVVHRREDEAFCVLEAGEHASVRGTSGP